MILGFLSQNGVCQFEGDVLQFESDLRHFGVGITKWVIVWAIVLRNEMVNGQVPWTCRHLILLPTFQP